jgi:hypothetical protein
VRAFGVAVDHEDVVAGAIWWRARSCTCISMPPRRGQVAVGDVAILMARRRYVRVAQCARGLHPGVLPRPPGRRGAAHRRHPGPRGGRGAIAWCWSARPRRRGAAASSYGRHGTLAAHRLAELHRRRRRSALRASSCSATPTPGSTAGGGPGRRDRVRPRRRERGGARAAAILREETGDVLHQLRPTGGTGTPTRAGAPGGGAGKKRRREMKVVLEATVRQGHEEERSQAVGRVCNG